MSVFLPSLDEFLLPSAQTLSPVRLFARVPAEAASPSWCTSWRSCNAESPRLTRRFDRDTKQSHRFLFSLLLSSLLSRHVRASGSATVWRAEALEACQEADQVHGSNQLPWEFGRVVRRTLPKETLHRQISTAEPFHQSHKELSANITVASHRELQLKQARSCFSAYLPCEKAHSCRR